MVEILDATLREGEQTQGVKFSLEQKVEIAKKLDEFGVDYIEAGMPIISDYDFQAVKAVAHLGLRAEVLGHARAKPEDIVAVANSGCKWVGIFCGINDLSIAHRIHGKNKEGVYDMIGDSIRYAKKLGLKVRYTVEDATRTHSFNLIEIAELAERAGADRFSIADTVGCASPELTSELVSGLKKEVKIPLEVHCHNDLGLALANSLAAYNAGADVLDAAVNGLGERTGITSLQELSLALAHLHKQERYSKRNLSILTDLSELVAKCSGVRLDALRPVTGENAFTHTAKLHTKAVGFNPKTYESINPQDVGRERKIAVPNIIIPKKIPATELDYHHKNAPGERYVFVDDRFFPDSKFYVIGRRVERVPRIQEKYVDSHAHKCPSLFIFVGDDDGLEGLCADVKTGDKTYRNIKSPRAILVPAGLSHSYKLTKGRGWFFNIIQNPNYQTSLLSPEAETKLGSLRFISAERRDSPPKTGERPVTTDSKVVLNPIRYVFDTKGTGFYIALHDLNEDANFAYTMVPHYHDTEEFYIFFNRAGEQLVVDLEINGQPQRTNAPALAYYRKGDIHKYSHISGFGKMLVVLQERNLGEGYHFKRTSEI